VRGCAFVSQSHTVNEMNADQKAANKDCAEPPAGVVKNAGYLLHEQLPTAPRLPTSREQLTSLVLLDPYFPAFTSALGDCSSMGVFSTVTIHRWKPEVTSRLFHANEFAGKCNCKAEGAVEQRYQSYASLFSAIDEGGQQLKTELLAQQQLTKKIRPFLPLEERFQWSTIARMLYRLKSEINELFLPGLLAQPRAAASSAVVAPEAVTNSNAIDSGTDSSGESEPSSSGETNVAAATGKERAQTKAKRNGKSKGKGNGTKVGTKRVTLPKAAVTALRKWLFAHFAHPYPTDDEKQMLATATSLQVIQVNYWFINARVRIWRPMIESMEATQREQQLQASMDPKGTELSVSRSLEVSRR